MLTTSERYAPKVK